MERVKPSRPCASPQKMFIADDEKIEKFNLPVTDIDVIKLHSIFMQPVVSTIQMPDVFQGRILVQKILYSLNYYNYIGCLSTIRPVAHGSIDIFKIIQKYAQVYGLQHAINQFFIENAQLEFIWIELTESLIAQIGQSNFDYFIKIMTQHQTMPVIIVRYTI